MIPMIGFASGPSRMIGGALQVVVNAIIAIFLLIKLSYDLIATGSGKRTLRVMLSVLRDLSVGGLHIVRGIYETIPFTSIIIFETEKQRYYVPNGDNPFSWKKKNKYLNCKLIYYTTKISK